MTRQQISLLRYVKKPRTIEQVRQRLGLEKSRFEKEYLFVLDSDFYTYADFYDV